MTYTPPLNFVGTDTFTYSVCDPFGACTAGLVEIDVLPINDPPVGGPDSVVVDGDSTTIIDVLANDTDVDSDVLTVTTIDTTGTLGAVSINPDGTISYTPPVGYNGPDSFTYTVCDPGGLCDVVTVDLVVAPLPDPPIAVDDSSTGNEDTQQVIAVLANDTDGDGDTLSLSSITQPANGTTVANPDGTVTYAPAAGFNGIDSFAYTVCDPSGACDTALVTIMVNGTGGLTGRVWLDMNFNGIINAGETNISGVRVYLDYAGADGVFGTADDQLALAQTVTAGPYQFTGLLAGVYRVRVDVATLPAGLYWTYDLDGQFDSQARVVVNAGATTTAVDFGYAIGNTAPVANDDGVITTPEDLSVTIDVLPNDADPDGQQLAVTSVTQPAHGTVVVNNDGTITYLPSAEYSGPDSFTYTVCEVTQTPLVGDPEGLCDSATVTINVTFVNDAPYVDPTILTVTVGSSVPPLGVFDPEGDDYVVVLAGGTLPPGVTLNPDGTFSGTPSRVGSYTFVVEVCDTFGACSTSVISIVVQQGATSGGTLPLPDDDTSTPPSTLPFTGIDSAWVAATAMLLMLGGALLLLVTGNRTPSPVARRRRDQH